MRPATVVVSAEEIRVARCLSLLLWALLQWCAACVVECQEAETMKLQNAESFGTRYSVPQQCVSIQTISTDGVAAHVSRATNTLKFTGITDKRGELRVLLEAHRDLPTHSTIQRAGNLTSRENRSTKHHKQKAPSTVFLRFQVFRVMRREKRGVVGETPAL